MARSGTTVKFELEVYRLDRLERVEPVASLPFVIGSGRGADLRLSGDGLAPEHVRLEARAPGGGFETSGVSGDPTRATVEYGEKGIELKVSTAVTRIRELIAAR